MEVGAVAMGYPLAPLLLLKALAQEDGESSRRQIPLVGRAVRSRHPTVEEGVASILRLCVGVWLPMQGPLAFA